jgi:hypothetical protein
MAPVKREERLQVLAQQKILLLQSAAVRGLADAGNEVD